MTGGDRTVTQTMTARQRELALARKLVGMIDLMVNQSAALSDEARRVLPAEVAHMRQTLFGDDAPRLVGAEAACVVELMLALDAARSVQGEGTRESRLKMFLNSFVPFLEMDITKAAIRIEREAPR